MDDIFGEPGVNLGGLEEFTDFVDDFHASPEFIRKEKERGRELRASQWWKNRRSSGICYYCGRKFAPSALTMDHLVPIARGGRSVRGNIVPCCKERNTRNSTLLPVEWREYLERISGEAKEGGRP